MSIKLRLLLFKITLGFKLRSALNKFGFGVFARALKLQSCLWWKLKYQLRLLDDASLSEGFDPKFDKIVHLAALRLADPETVDENVHKLLYDDLSPHVASLGEDTRKRLRLDYEANKEAVDQLVASHGGIAPITTTLTRYFQVKSFLQNYLGNEKRQEYYISSAKRYDPEVSVPDVKTIRALLHETRREVKSLEASISDREALKISLSSQNFTAVLSMLSGLFLVSGYLYSRAFLGHYGVEVAHYFSLSDYIAASIEGIRYSVAATVLGILGAFLGEHSISRMSYAQAARTTIDRRFIYFLSTAGACGVAIIAYFQDTERFYALTVLSILMLSAWPVRWLVRHYFKDKDWTLADFLILAVLLFSLYLFASIRTDIHRIEHGEANDLKQYNISFKEPVTFNPETTVLLAANSRYLFLRDTASGKVYIIPTDQVQNIVVRNEEPIQ